MPTSPDLRPRTPWQFIPQEDLDALATLGSAGDREAQTRLVEAFSNNCIAWSDAQIAKRPKSLEAYRADVLQDANFGFLDAIRRYRPERGHFPTWAKRNVTLYLRRKTRGYLSRSGCRVDKEWLDFGSPHFRATAWVGPEEDGRGAAALLTAPDSDDTEEARKDRAWMEAEARRIGRRKIGIELAKVPAAKRLEVVRKCGFKYNRRRPPYMYRCKSFYAKKLGAKKIYLSSEGTQPNRVALHQTPPYNNGMKKPALLEERAALAFLNKSFPIGRSAFLARVADGSIPRVHFGGRKIFYDPVDLKKYVKSGKRNGHEK